jgi:predicted RNA-binding Zn-ribbon protein involved in translation (DUF1610 family)
MHTTIFVASARQVQFLKLLMYERLDMSIEEIEDQGVEKFSMKEASALITEWTAMPQLRKAPLDVFRMDAKSTTPSPSEARAALAARAGGAAVPGSIANGAPIHPDKEQREYPCFKCDATIVGITALRHHQRFDCPKTGRTKTVSVVATATTPAYTSYAARPAAAPAVPTPAKGRYAVIGDSGEWEFYRVTERSTSRWNSRKELVLMKQAGDRFNFIGREAKYAIAVKINADPKTAMKEYGVRLGMCGVCGRSLTDPESRSRGIGPDCWTRF